MFGSLDRRPLKLVKKGYMSMCSLAPMLDCLDSYSTKLNKELERD